MESAKGPCKCTQATAFLQVTIALKIPWLAFTSIIFRAIAVELAPVIQFNHKKG